MRSRLCFVPSMTHLDVLALNLSISRPHFHTQSHLQTHTAMHSPSMHHHKSRSICILNFLFARSGALASN